jgi:hypothetical protein
MEVVITSLTVPDLEEVKHRGSSHPMLGPLLDGGSYCTVDGVAATAESMSEIVRAARAAALEAAVPFVEVTDPASLPAGGNGLVLLVSVPAPADLGRIGERAALCLLIADGAAQSRPIAVLYGRSLPALGPVPPCTVRDLLSTWISLAGGTPKDGRHLLHEQPEVWDPQIERQLTRRLRQLYGE